MKENSKTKWFDLPVVEEDVDWWTVQKEVYINMFSNDVFDFFSSKYFSNKIKNSCDESNNCTTIHETEPLEKSDNIDDIKSRLESLECDCWEDLASSDDENEEQHD